MRSALQPLVGSLFDWLEGEPWRPLVGMLVGIVMITIIGWWLARRLRRQARAAGGMAWLLGGVVLLVLFFAAATIDALAVGSGGSVVEAALLGWLPGVDLVLPLDRLPVVGAVVYLFLLGLLYALIVWGIWWSLVSGAHLGDADRAQSQGWLYLLTGRAPDGRLLPGFVRWFKPLLILLSLVLATSFLQLVLGEHPPHPAAWVTAGLFVTGAYMNLRAPGVVAPKPAAASSEVATEDAATARAPVSAADIVRALGEAGHSASADTVHIAPRPAQLVSQALAGAHPLTRAYCNAISTSNALYLFQADMLTRSREGRPALYVGPHGSGRTSGLSLVVFDVALSRWETVLVVVPTAEAAAAFAAGLRRVLSRGVTPDVVRVAAGLVELAEERQAGHDAVIFVTTPEELRLEVLSRASLSPAFYRGLGAVLVDDLERLGPEAVTALRLALHELRAVVSEAREGASSAPAVLATATAVGNELEPWASDILGERLVVVPTDGAPLSACDVVVVDSEDSTGVTPPGSIVTALAGLGFAVEIVDEVHAGVAGRGSFVPLPCWELTAAGAAPGPLLGASAATGVGGTLPNPGVDPNPRSGVLDVSAVAARSSSVDGALPNPGVDPDPRPSVLAISAVAARSSSVVGTVPNPGVDPNPRPGASAPPAAPPPSSVVPGTVPNPGVDPNPTFGASTPPAASPTSSVVPGTVPNPGVDPNPRFDASAPPAPPTSSVIPGTVPNPGVDPVPRTGAAGAGLTGAAQVAKLLLVRRADVALAVERHRPVGAGGARLLVLYVLDRDGVPWSVIAEALAAARDPAGGEDKPLRLMPVGRSVPDVVRRHLVATVSRPRRLDWLQAVFPAAELDALFEAVGGLAGVSSAVTVLEDEPPELVPRTVVTIPSAAELAKQPRWRASPRVSVRATEDGAELFTLDAELSKVLLPPRAAFVDEGRRWEVVRRTDAVVYATRRRSPLVIHAVKDVVVTPGPVLIPDITLTFTPGHPLTLGAYQVTVRETITALERRTPSGAFDSREALSEPAVAEYKTTAIRLLATSSTASPPSPATTTALLQTLTALTTLTEDEFELIPPSAGSTPGWLLDRSSTRGGQISWLIDRVVTNRSLWRGEQVEPVRLVEDS